MRCNTSQRAFPAAWQGVVGMGQCPGGFLALIKADLLISVSLLRPCGLFWGIAATFGSGSEDTNSPALINVTENSAFPSLEWVHV